jgi:Tfp pilus assembly protein PilV
MSDLSMLGVQTIAAVFVLIGVLALMAILVHAANTGYSRHQREDEVESSYVGEHVLHH